MVLAAKRDGTKQLCCDYRKLNEKIIRDNFPMAVIDDVIQILQSANVFTTLDLTNGFFTAPVEKDSLKYTAFVTHNSVYEFYSLLLEYRILKLCFVYIFPQVLANLLMMVRW